MLKKKIKQLNSVEQGNVFLNFNFCLKSISWTKKSVNRMPSFMDSTVKILKTIPFFWWDKKGSWLGFHETNSNSAIVLIICFVSIFDAVIAVFRNQHMHDEYEDLHSEPWYATSYLMIIATIYLFVLLKISYFNLRGQLLSQHVIETDHPPPLSFNWDFFGHLA